jgi:hypothetical protein
MIMAFRTELEAAMQTTAHGMLIAWLQLRLDSTEENLPALMAAFAAANGAQDWASLGEFPPAS